MCVYFCAFVGVTQVHICISIAQLQTQGICMRRAGKMRAAALQQLQHNFEFALEYVCGILYL